MSERAQSITAAFSDTSHPGRSTGRTATAPARCTNPPSPATRDNPRSACRSSYRSAPCWPRSKSSEARDTRTAPDKRRDRRVCKASRKSPAVHHDPRAARRHSSRQPARCMRRSAVKPYTASSHIDRAPHDKQVPESMHVSTNRRSVYARSPRAPHSNHVATQDACPKRECMLRPCDLEHAREVSSRQSARSSAKGSIVTRELDFARTGTAASGAAERIRFHCRRQLQVQKRKAPRRRPLYARAAAVSGGDTCS